ncbi:MAG: HD domain-containing protein [Defluviitaleaceae bacterium]|nr:HD domain-containing protein [Defluviitaleaceae bacterium]
MLFGLIMFLKSLAAFRAQAHEQEIFTDRIYTASMALTILFLIGYIFVGAMFMIRSTMSTTDLIISLLLFFGAIFVCAMVITLKKMSAAISRKTDEITKTLVNAMEAKDHYTQGHSVHVAEIVRLIYGHLPDRIKNGICRTRLMDAAILHDIGKIGIPDNILNKPGKLSSEERKIIEQHVTYGKNILEPTSYQHIGDIVYYHHERLDGRGYLKVAAEDIPIEARIITVADTFSALSTDRIYRPRKSYDEAIRIIKEVADTQLDTEIVAVLCEIPKELLEAKKDEIQ